MQTYEYRFVEVANGKVKTVNGEAMPYTDSPTAHDYANELGRAGWRLVGVASASSYAYTLIYMRAGDAAEPTELDDIDFLNADLESDLLDNG